MVCQDVRALPPHGLHCLAVLTQGYIHLGDRRFLERSLQGLVEEFPAKFAVATAS